MKLAKEKVVPWSYTSKVHAAILAHLELKTSLANHTSICFLASSSALDMGVSNIQRER